MRALGLWFVWIRMDRQFGRLPNFLQETHFFTLRMSGYHTELSGKPSPQPVQFDFWITSTYLVSSPRTGWTGRNPVCDTIGSTVALPTHTLDSTRISVSHTPDLKRFTRPFQTVGSSGSTPPSISSPGSSQKSLPVITLCPTYKDVPTVSGNWCCSAPLGHRRTVLLPGNELPVFENRVGRLLPQDPDLVLVGVLYNVRSRYLRSGIDSLMEIENSERLFRVLGLPGFITGKEGYPTVGVNMQRP